MNQWNATGRLTRDPEVRRTTQDSVVIANFSIAVYRDSDNTDFVDCVCFNRLAEYAEERLRKGFRVAVTGPIQIEDYTNKDGEKGRAVKCIVNRIEQFDFIEENSGYSGRKNYRR